MANVRIKRAITYIALGATTSLGGLARARATTDDGAPAGAPRAMSASPTALTLPEHLSFARLPMLPPLTLTLAQRDAAPAAPNDASPEMREAPPAQLADSAESAQPDVVLTLTAPAPLATAKKSPLATLLLRLGSAERPEAPTAPNAAAETERPDATEEAAAVTTVAPAATVASAMPVTVAPVALHGDAALPVPEALVPQVEFWKRVYTEVDSAHGFVHDAWHLDVVYETVAVPAGTRRQSVRGIAREVARVSGMLRNLARGHRDNPSVEEARVLAAWPKDVSNATLLEAARNVRFQTGQSDKFRAGLARAQTWTPFIVSTFTAAGLPRELAALPHVESSFNMMAYSKVRAAGIWQFMPATARLFMHMDSTVDERLDPIRSTESAAHLLAQNYRLLGSWPLAITAYNHGPEGVHRAMKKTGSTDLAVIIATYKTRHFGFASRNFYTELLAAWEVSQHPEKYFGSMPSEAPMQYETVTTDAFYHAKSVASALGVELAVLRAHNPALRPAVWSNGRLIPRGFTMRVPRGLVHGDMLAMLSAIPQGERFAHVDLAPGRSAGAAHHHPVAVAQLHNARRFVAQRRTAAKAAPAGTQTANAVVGPLPWEKQAAAPAPTAPVAASRSWFE